MIGDMPSQDFCIRHINNIEISNVEISAMADDARPAFILKNVEGTDFFRVKTLASVAPTESHDCIDVAALWVRGVKDGKQA